VTGASPFVDVWDDGSMHVYWFRTPSPIIPVTLLGSMWKAGNGPAAPDAELEPEAAAAPPPASVALAPSISLVAAPARGVVTVRWGGERPAGARLAIYSVTGRLVARAPVGARAFRWDEKDEAGVGVAAGIYWARLIGDSGFKADANAKIIVLR